MPVIDWAQRPIYLITDGSASRSSEFDSPTCLHDTLLELIQHAPTRLGAIQLREQIGDDPMSDTDLCWLVRELREVALSNEIPILVNRRIDLATQLGVGVHLQVPTANIGMAIEAGVPFIGYSAHSLNEANAAFDSGASFVTLSPIFMPQSKKHYRGEIFGLEKLKEACGVLGPGRPVIGLGGVSVTNISTLLSTGVSGFGCINAVFSAPDKALAITELLRGWDQS